jgi:hypothetical protein
MHFIFVISSSFACNFPRSANKTIREPYFGDWDRV